MNAPLILTPARFAGAMRPRHSHRSRRRRLVGALAMLMCALALGLPLLAGIAVGGMAGIITREHWHREVTPAARAVPERAGEAVYTAAPETTTPPAADAGATEAATLTRALRRVYRTAHSRTAESEVEGGSWPSA